MAGDEGKKIAIAPNKKTGFLAHKKPVFTTIFGFSAELCSKNSVLGFFGVRINKAKP